MPSLHKNNVQSVIGGDSKHVKILLHQSSIPDKIIGAYYCGLILSQQLPSAIRQRRQVSDEFIFLQNGAPPYWAAISRALLFL